VKTKRNVDFYSNKLHQNQKYDTIYFHFFMSKCIRERVQIFDGRLSGSFDIFFFMNSSVK
jgi:hypothetical protein